jgi:PAS domain S-box-containing protein
MLAAASVAPMLAFSVLIVIWFSHAEQARFEAQMSATARALLLAADREVSAQMTMLTALSASPALAAGDWARLYRDATGLVGFKGERRFALITPSRHQIMNTGQPFGTVLPDAYGPAVAAALNTGAPFVSGLFHSNATGRDIFGVYQPVFSDGRIAYVAALGVAPSALQQLLAENTISGELISTLVDRDGKILARSKDAETRVGQMVSDRFATRLRTHGDGLFDGTDSHGHRLHVVYARSSLTGWTAALAVTHEELVAPLHRSLWIIGTGGACMLLLAAGSAAVIGRRISRPLGALADAAAALGRGEHPTLPPLPLLEAQTIAAEMTRAADQLRIRGEENQALMQGLESRVQTRTAALVESERRYQMLAETTSDMITQIDPQGRRVYISPACRLLLGYQPEELIGRNSMELVHPQDVPGYEEYLLKLRAGVPDIRFEYRIRRKDGSYTWIETAGKPLFDPATGAQIGGVASSRDIAVRKAAEERAARAMAEATAASRAKSEFLASMSHELRTPLNAISGFAQLLLHDAQMGAREQQWLRHILKGAKQLLALVNDVLDLAGAESGQLQVTIARVPLAPVLHEALATLQQAAEQKHVALIMAPLPEALAARADADRLLQVVLNLVSNAIKYNREGGWVRVAGEAGAPGRVRITVSDSGKGISPEQIPSLFGAFERLGEECGVIEGAGVGLAIVRRLTQMMDGTVGVSSVPGEGSRFWIDLPASTEATLPAAAPREIDGPAAAGKLPAVGSLTVLYIEDNASAVALMRDIAALPQGCRLLTAGTGSLGLTLAAHHRPDLVIVDINLPGMNGYEVLRRLRADPETAAIPVVALTGEALPADVEAGRRAGFDDYLTKPFSIQRLMELFRRVSVTRDPMLQLQERREKPAIVAEMAVAEQASSALDQ